ncbi:MAG: hypothetical protein J0G94_11505 [Sphingomonadales bacterium]|nr:hypothetical protein [Sphingomonadales bacterium]
MRHALHALGRLKAGTMNKTEARYEAEVLAPLLQAKEILWYRFEGIKLRLADNTFLTVDFPMMRADGLLVMVDVKGAPGVITEDARVKMKVAADQYPFAFRFAWPLPRKQGGGWGGEEL